MNPASAPMSHTPEQQAEQADLDPTLESAQFSQSPESPESAGEGTMGQAHAPAPPRGLDARAIVASYLRTYLIMANFNTRGLQNIGLVYAMEPGLVAIWGRNRDLVAARRRYLKLYNTHPFWTPLLVGVFLHLEQDIRRGAMQPEVLDNVKQTVTYTLSAIGDSFFGGSMLALWALATICLVVAGQMGLAVALGALMLAGLNAFKLVGFGLGLRQGFTVLPLIRRLNLVNWGRRIKYVNCVLLAVFWSLAWPQPYSVWLWVGGVALVGLGAWLVARTGAPRELVVAAAFLGYMTLPWLVRLLLGLETVSNVPGFGG